MGVFLQREVVGRDVTVGKGAIGSGKGAMAFDTPCDNKTCGPVSGIDTPVNMPIDPPVDPPVDAAADAEAAADPPVDDAAAAADAPEGITMGSN